MTFWNSSSVYSVKGLLMNIPALLIKVSMRRKRSTAILTTCAATLRFANVTSDCDDTFIARRLDATGIGYHNEAVVSVGLDELSTDALRGASDNGDFLFIAHSSSFPIETRNRRA
jgi:hypothetical protein